MSASGVGRGEWVLYSKSDPRWKWSGTAPMSGSAIGGDEVENIINRLKELIGEEPPEDLTVSWCKY